MEGICIVGGIKSEPSLIIKSEPTTLIKHEPPDDGPSVEITFSDFDSEEDEAKPVIDVQPSFVSERAVSSDKKDLEKKDYKTQDVFKYMGYDHANTNRVEKCIFNFTRNEDLFVHIKKNEQIQDQLPTLDLTNHVSDIDSDKDVIDGNRILKSLLGSTGDGSMNGGFLKPDSDEESRLKSRASCDNDKETPKQTFLQTTGNDVNKAEDVKEYVPMREKMALYTALFSENLFKREYRNMGAYYRCMHCKSHGNTLEDVQVHIIENHRKTDLKQCLYCDLKTKVLQHHLESHFSSCTDNNRSEPAHELPESEQNVNPRRANRKLLLSAALFSEDISNREYCRRDDGTYSCLRCSFVDTLINIKTHIIKLHRKTEEKQCPLCHTGTKVLTYHLRKMHRRDVSVQASALLAEYATGNKRIKLEKNLEGDDQLFIYQKRRRTKIDLKMALFSEDLSYLEYAKRKDNFRCLHCSYQDSLENIKIHIIENHRKTEFKQCPFCDVQTRVLKYHLRTHATPLEYKCKECNYEAINTGKLNRHIRVHHEDRVAVQCTLCQKVYQSQIHLVNHIRRSHAGNVYSCQYCDYTSNVKTAVDLHMERHKDEGELKTLFKCDKCDYQTKYRRKMHAHRGHRHKWFVCDQCGTKLTTRNSLKLHMLLHKDKLEDEDLPFRCNMCDYKTNRQHNLTMHNLKHKKPEEIEYFYCYHCSFKATRKDNLKTHIFKHFQKEEVVFRCFVCDFAATKKHVLIRHIDTHSRAKEELETTVQ